MSADEIVGPGRPPRKHQFKKGQSGNPSGRPKGSRNFKAILEAEMNRRVTIQDGGRERRVTLKEVMGRQLANAAAKGSIKHAQVIMSIIGFGEENEKSEANVSVPDAKALRRIGRSIQRLLTAGDTVE